MKEEKTRYLTSDKGLSADEVDNHIGEVVEDDTTWTEHIWNAFSTVKTLIKNQPIMCGVLCLFILCWCILGSLLAGILVIAGIITFFNE